LLSKDNSRETEIQASARNVTTLESLLPFSSAIGLASVILYALTIDRLVGALYEHHNADWVDLGRPVGVFTIPKDTQWWQGMIAHLGLVCDVLVATPAWLTDKPDLLFLVKKIRWCLALAVLSVMAGTVMQWVASR
jgi:hypothetical protein